MTTKENLLDQALTLFSKEGYDGVSVRKIAKAAGITEGSIYNHFKSKKEILEELFKIHESELIQNLPTSEGLINNWKKPDWKPAWEYRIDMIEKIGPSIMDLRILQLLSSEQYRNEIASIIILKYYINGPITITEDLFKYLLSTGRSLPGSPEVLARLYQYPLFTLTQE